MQEGPKESKNKMHQNALDWIGSCSKFLVAPLLPPRRSWCGSPQNTTQDSGSASTSTCYFNKKPFLQKVEHVFKAHVLQICSLFLI